MTLGTRTPGVGRRRFLRTTAGLAASLALGCGSRRPAADPPNLILLLADDLGWGDLGCFGSTRIRTPRLDALARAGSRWTQFYAASATCSPTRCSCLTGRYPLRFGFTAHRGSELRNRLPDQTVTLPRLLRDAGYLTAHVGKWHLGGNNLAELGFEQFLKVHYPAAKLGGEGSNLYLEGARYLRRNREPLPPREGFLTDVLVDESIAIIEAARAAGRPFFLNLWFYAPHTPYNLAPAPHVEPYRGLADGDDLKYRSLVTCMDAGIGRIAETLERLGIGERTLTVFTSDNGPSYQGETGPWTGGKADLHEGGIRMPTLFHWPGRVRAGQVADWLGHTNDLLPTFCAAAGVDLPGDVVFDGVDLTPTFGGAAPAPRGPVFWQMDLYDWYPRPGGKPLPHATEVVRRDRWKLLARDAAPLGLFDLEADPAETRNLVDERPAVRDELASALARWLEEARRPPDR